MRAAQDQMYRLIDRTLGRLDDLFDCWMTAPDNENNAVGRVDRQRDFLHLQVDAPSPIQQDQMESGRHLGRLGYPCEIALRPRAAETQRLRRSPVEITHVRRQGFVSPVESAWQGRTEHTEVFLRHIDLHRGVDLQKMI